MPLVSRHAPPCAARSSASWASSCTHACTHPVVAGRPSAPVSCPSWASTGALCEPAAGSWARRNLSEKPVVEGTGDRTRQVSARSGRKPKVHATGAGRFRQTTTRGIPGLGWLLRPSTGTQPLAAIAQRSHPPATSSHWAPGHGWRARGLGLGVGDLRRCGRPAASRKSSSNVTSDSKAASTLAPSAAAPRFISTQPNPTNRVRSTTMRSRTATVKVAAGPTSGSSLGRGRPRHLEEFALDQHEIGVSPVCLPREHPRPRRNQTSFADRRSGSFCKAARCALVLAAHRSVGPARTGSVAGTATAR